MYFVIYVVLVLTIGFGSIYLVYLHQSAIASWPKHGFSMITFQRLFYNDHFLMPIPARRAVFCSGCKADCKSYSTNSEAKPKYSSEMKKLLNGGSIVSARHNSYGGSKANGRTTSSGGHSKEFEEHLKTIWCVIAAIADMVSVEMMTNLSLLK